LKELVGTSDCRFWVLRLKSTSYYVLRDVLLWLNIILDNCLIIFVVYRFIHHRGGECVWVAWLLLVVGSSLDQVTFNFKLLVISILRCKQSPYHIFQFFILYLRWLSFLLWFLLVQVSAWINWNVYILRCFCDAFRDDVVIWARKRTGTPVIRQEHREAEVLYNDEFECCKVHTILFNPFFLFLFFFVLLTAWF
jgi:hypothetical protein